MGHQHPDWVHPYAGVLQADLDERYRQTMTGLLQLHQVGTTAAYTRQFYGIISGGTPGISDTVLKQVYLLGLRSPRLRAAMMQMPLRHMELVEVTDHACALAMQLDY
jgi:hypothetical protein